jgi:hypothetical protein
MEIFFFDHPFPVATHPITLFHILNPAFLSLDGFLQFNFGRQYPLTKHSE